MKSPIQELIRTLRDLEQGADVEDLMSHIDKHEAYYIEREKQAIVEAHRQGRVAGAIFKAQKDSEGLAEQYHKDLYGTND